MGFAQYGADRYLLNVIVASHVEGRALATALASAVPEERRSGLKWDDGSYRGETVWLFEARAADASRGALPVFAQIAVRTGPFRQSQLGFGSADALLYVGTDAELATRQLADLEQLRAMTVVRRRGPPFLGVLLSTNAPTARAHEFEESLNPRLDAPLRWVHAPADWGAVLDRTLEAALACDARLHG